MVSRAPHGDQTWRTFVRNHARELWACDFLTQYTAFFAVAYIFIIMQEDSAMNQPRCPTGARVCPGTGVTVPLHPIGLCDDDAIALPWLQSSPGPCR